MNKVPTNARILTPFTEFARGLRGYWAGIRWLLAHPWYFLLLLMPIVIAFTAFGFGFGLILKYNDIIFSHLLFDRPEEWWKLGFFFLLEGILYISFFIFCFLGFVLFANILASPVYDFVSVAIERDVTGGPVSELSFLKSIKLLGEEFKKAVFILVTTLAVMMIPFLNVFSIFIAAFLLGWEFYDYPLARRGWTFRQRLGFVMKDMWSVMGFGLWMMIPFLNFFLVPFAVAGGTLLNLDALKRREGNLVFTNSSNH